MTLIPILVILTQIAIILLCAGGMLALYTLGARAGANTAALLELYDAFPDLRPAQPLTQAERDLREEYKAKAQDFLYRRWLSEYKLTDNAITRELFKDKDYREKLRGQSHD